MAFWVKGTDFYLWYGVPLDMDTTISQSDALLLLEIISECVACKMSNDVGGVIDKVHKIIDFDNAVYGLAKLDSDGSIVSYNTLNISYPKEWLDVYAEKGFCNIDPISKENFTNYNLQYWADTYKKWPCPKNFFDTATEFNLNNGFACGEINLKRTEGGLLSIAGKLINDSRNRFILETLTHHLHQAFHSVLSSSKKKPTLSLSRREKEVTNWIKVGKSSWDISVILGISERTVKFHVDNIMLKLDAVSRTHAVAIALAEGLIDID